MVLINLIYEFFKTGLFAVGGGLATLPFLFDIAEKYPWFDTKTLANMVAISESTPGPLGVNMATFAGFETMGVLGAISATLALVFPSYVIIVIIYKFLQKFKDNKLVEYAFIGMRPAVTGLIGVAVLGIVKMSLFNFDLYNKTKIIIDMFNFKSIILFGLLFIFIRKFKLHPIIYILIGGIVGIIFAF